ncbi:dihydrouridine synthase DuS [Pseudodesulfovibrio mercurii]|uniref:tRNA-dihydrouridine synthase n=1 Tax=Pseudodesulfovibrio mercurii TaxID=641491 RepID=F0JI75_9BACT|nr:tRNA-dihydrouridine synthase family protein [Pseudodesulfovibrio mercurii]EGB15386.1 dihydrouridine synthase DuS [Pseudodesulfovibrio mercurii]
MQLIEDTLEGELAERLNRPLTVGGRTVANRLWLAPLAGLSHVAFREVLDGYGGCGLTFTEMCGAKSLPTESPLVSPVFRWRAAELPRLVCQVAGATPEQMIPAARRVQECGFFGFDINMGCSVSGIIKKNAGAALLRDPDAALRVVEGVRRAISIPLFVKFRTGWTPDIGPAVALARRFEDAGVDCLVFHPRVAPDKRTRPPVREHIRAVVDAVSIPVFGNGDVVSPEDCLDMLRTTGCAGVSVGRTAIARPWLFAQWTTGQTPPATCFRDYALNLADALSRHFDPVRALKRYRMFTIYFAANFTFGHALQSRFLKAKTMDEIRSVAQNHIPPDLQLVRRPNFSLYNI